MRLLKSVLMIGLVALLIAGCKSSEQIAAEKKALDEDTAKLQGTWKLTDRTGATSDPDEKGADEKGAEENKAPETGVLYKIENDMLEIKEGNNPTYFKLSLYPLKEPNKQVDLLLTEANGKPIQRTVFVKSKKKGKVEWKEKKRDDRRPGIYKIEGDTLTICFAYPEKDRPDSFTAPIETGRTLWVLKKVKEADQKDAKEKAKKE